MARLLADFLLGFGHPVVAEPYVATCNDGYNEIAWKLYDQIVSFCTNLYDHENVKIFATSSSASILQDTRGFLTGRSRGLEMLPLDFEEFLAFRGLKVSLAEGYMLEAHFETFMQMGGLPEYVLTDDVSYLDNLIDSIIYKDIVVRYGVQDVTGIKDFFRLLMERAGKQISLNKVARILGVSPDTIRRYLHYFRQTFLVYAIER
ncbi:MAG: AAA family ATPase [candidate division KSB1 bacterium]|nr:AAA family ATPase [candidate division KSB1 bacterium]